MATLEQASSVEGDLVGWNRSMTPTATVQLDSLEPYEGESSLRMENRSKQTSAWVQTQPMNQPIADRLAADFFLRVEQGTSPIQLVITTTGIRANGTKFQANRILPIPKQDDQFSRRSHRKNVGSPPWTHCMLPLLQDAASESLNQVQVSFDLKGVGTVWLDQVTFYDRYLP